ncbi:hypothetical protein [Beijerinckia indica]|nr:hypothetical protein [Beijerinckia indica]
MDPQTAFQATQAKRTLTAVVMAAITFTLLTLAAFSVRRVLIT